MQMGHVNPPPVGYPAWVVSSLASAHSNGRAASILVIDDDEYIHGALAGALRGMRVHMLAAHTAAEGTAMVLEHRPALAVVDVGLPDRDGYELVADLRSDPSLASMRILILTGQDPDQEAARHSGANAVIQKPFRLHDFLDLVRDLLGSGEARGQPYPAAFAGRA
jgi:DNA-binding response OmpR family regulator